MRKSGDLPQTVKALFFCKKVHKICSKPNKNAKRCFESGQIKFQANDRAIEAEDMQYKSLITP